MDYGKAAYLPSVVWYYQIMETLISYKCSLIPYGASILTKKNPWRSFSQLSNVGFPKQCSTEPSAILQSVKRRSVNFHVQKSKSETLLYSRTSQKFCTLEISGERDAVSSCFLNFSFFKLQTLSLHGIPIDISRYWKRCLSPNWRN